MTADFGPCSPWEPVWTCDVSAKSPTATGIAVEAATEIMWALSGRRFGTCTTTLRPCRRNCYDTAWWGMYGAGWANTYTSPGYAYSAGRFGMWFELGCGSCNGECSCSFVSETILPFPVSSVVMVKMDGTPMATGAYRVDDNRRLVRTDGHAWPRCNDLSKNDDQPGTWSVTASYGEDVPELGKLAVGEMACELLRAMDGKDCRLPPGLTQLTRQGVSITLPLPSELFKEGKTGLYVCDAFISSVNPHGLARRSKVFSVDHRAPRRAGT